MARTVKRDSLHGLDSYSTQVARQLIPLIISATFESSLNFSEDSWGYVGDFREEKGSNFKMGSRQ